MLSCCLDHLTDYCLSIHYQESEIQIHLLFLQIPGLVNVDFADVRAIMASAGSSLMGIGTATGIVEKLFDRLWYTGRMLLTDALSVVLHSHARVTSSAPIFLSFWRYFTDSSCLCG